MDRHSKSVATPTGLSLLAQGSTKVAFGWKDCAHAQGGRTEVRIGFAIASGDPNGIIPAGAGSTKVAFGRKDCAHAG